MPTPFAESFADRSYIRGLAQLPVARMRLVAQQVAEPLLRLALDLGARGVDRREVRLPLPRPGRVDDRPRAVALAVLRDARVERTAPRAFDDVDGLHRVGPRAHGPDDVVEVHHVDVVVDDDDVAAEVRARVPGRGEVSHLAGMPRVALLDAHGVEEPRATDLVAPHAL